MATSVSDYLELELVLKVGGFDFSSAANRTNQGSTPHVGLCFWIHTWHLEL